MRLLLEHAEARILANPDDMRGRFVHDSGSITDINEPGLLFTYEETDSDTLTWLPWYDLWQRGD